MSDNCKAAQAAIAMDIEEESDHYGCPVLTKRARMEDTAPAETQATASAKVEVKTNAKHVEAKADAKGLQDEIAMETEEDNEELSQELLDSPVQTRKAEGLGAGTDDDAAAAAVDGGNHNIGPNAEDEAAAYNSDDDQPFPVLRLHAVAPSHPSGRNGVQINLPDPQEILDRIDPELIEEGKAVVIRGHHPDFDVFVIPVQMS